MKRHLLGLIIFAAALFYGLAAVQIHYEILIEIPDKPYCTA